MTSRTPSRRRGAAVPAAAALLLVTLTACGGDAPSDDAGSMPTIEQPQGAQPPTGIRGELPDSFPADDIPLVDGEVVSAGGTEEEGIWIVVIRSDDSVDAAKEAAVGLLTAAGFAESDKMPGMGAYTDGTYTVMVRTGQDDGQTIINYSITTAR